MQLLWQLLAGLMLQMPGFGPSPVHVGFVVDIMALGQAILLVLQFCLVIIISTVHQIY